MRDLVQPSQPPRTATAQAGKPSGPAVGQEFAEALRIDVGKGAPKARDGDKSAPTDLPPVWRIKIGAQALSAGMTIGEASRGALLQLAVENQGDAAGKEDAVQAEDEDASNNPLDALADILLAPEPAAGLEDKQPADDERLPEQDVAASAQAGAIAVVAVPLARAEIGPRAGRPAAPPEAADVAEAGDDVPAMRALVADAIHDGKNANVATASGALETAARQLPDTTSRQPGGSPAVAEAPAKTDEPPAGISKAALREAAPDDVAKTPEASRIPGNVRIIESHSLPAPTQASSPAATVTNAIAAAPEWTSLARTSTAQPVTSSAGPGPLKSLTIQLNPAELGVVTAKMRFAGEQLSIELQVERTEAYEKLSADQDAILKAVRALGIEVDRVTVQQSGAQNTTGARADNGPSFNGNGERGTGSFMPGGSSGQGSGDAGRQSSHRGSDETRSGSAGAGKPGSGKDGGDLYI